MPGDLRVVPVRRLTGFERPGAVTWLDFQDFHLKVEATL
jgi:hypothetical protein